MKQIPLTQGKFALVDDEDYDWLMQWKWYYALGYARRNEQVNGGRRVILMHREILGGVLLPGLVGDHVNRDGLDNRRSNLRVATYRQNCSNRTKMTRKKFLGVHPNGVGFYAKIKLPTGVVHLGTYILEDDAALAYNRAAKAHHGEFASLNDVLDDGRGLSSGRRLGASGLRGVVKRGKKWLAIGSSPRRQKHLGSFSTPEEAAAAVQNFKETNQLK
jgi:hypothetical protein